MNTTGLCAEREGNWTSATPAVRGGDPFRITEDPGMDWAAWSRMAARSPLSPRQWEPPDLYMRADGTEVKMLTEFAIGRRVPVVVSEGLLAALVPIREA